MPRQTAQILDAALLDEVEAGADEGKERAMQQVYLYTRDAWQFLVKYCYSNLVAHRTQAMSWSMAAILRPNSALLI